MTADQWLLLVALVTLAPLALVVLIALLRGYSIILRLDRHRRDRGGEADDA